MALELIPENYREIEYIQFGIFSSEEIRKLSVCQVNSAKLEIKPKKIDNDFNIKILSEDDEKIENEEENKVTLYDERMGLGNSIKDREKCVSCNMGPKNCSGHFGHIELNYPIIHPLCYKLVTHFLQCFCIECYSCLLNKEQVELKGLSKLEGEKRFNKILDIVSKIDICYNCNHPQPKITFKSTENAILMTYKQKKKDLPEGMNTSISIELDVLEILKIFQNIKKHDLELLGFNPTFIHPKDLILIVLLVQPPSTRPFVIADGKMCDDDLTCQLGEIIKINNYLGVDKQKDMTEQKKQKYINSLKFRIATLFDNSSGQAKHPTNGRAIKCIKKRLVGKGGLVRNNLMGKRVNFSARTVITPDAKLKVGEMAIPEEISKILTFPERVTKYNIDELTEIVNTGKATCIKRESDDGKQTTITLKYAIYNGGSELIYNDYLIRGNVELEIDKENNIIIPQNISFVKNGSITKIKDQRIYPKKGDRIVRNGKLLKNILFRKKNHIVIKIGDIVERHLQNGDMVLLNRQPTLHKGGMMAMSVKVRPGKTFSFNLSVCNSFNSDFDGDEMNIFPAQSYESKVELQYLSATKNHIISPQESKNNITIVQDSLLAAFIMTKNNDMLSRSDFYNISQYGEKLDGSQLWNSTKISNIRRVFKQFGKNPNPFTGKGLFSLLLPEDLCYTKKNNGTDEEPEIKIYNGVLYEGVLNKDVLGGVHNSLIQIIHKEYGVDYACNFIDNTQFITNNWLMLNGFSVGLEDCMISSKENIQSIKNNLTKCYIEAEGIETTTQNLGIREIRVTAALSKAKDIGMKIAKNDMKLTNNLLFTVNSGSKGSFFNIAQLTGLLGQQNLQGIRVSPTLNNGKRTLVHYPFKGMNKKTEYESRGFIRHSFIHGLNPQEFYFHCMSGREGVCDTAMGTAKSGYIQRRIVKLCEDLQVQYDGTVRDTTGKIYQWSYNKGLDPTKVIKTDGKLKFCNINRLAEKLNMQYEINTRLEEEPNIEFDEYKKIQ